MRPELAALAVIVMGISGCFGGKDAPRLEPVTTGSISGFVVNEAVVPLAGVNVTVAANQTVTNQTGAFSFTGLAPGSYIVRAEAPLFLPRETTVQVVAGNVTVARLVLPVDVAALAFNQTYTFKGFVNAHGGSSAPSLGDCQCNFTVPLEANWRSIVTEARWTDTVNAAAGPTQYSWTLTAPGQDGRGEGPSPLLGRIDVNASGPAGSATLQVEPSSTHVYFNQQFEVSATVFYAIPAPQGWRPAS